jgi:flagellar hook-basal body complex protein FliE
MTVTPSVAAAAYQAVSKMGTGGLPGAAGTTETQGFSQALSQAMHDAMSTIRAGEDASVKQAAGKADIVNVVSAVNAAELTLDTVVAVRDKVIAAYQNVMQMAI